jgi:hypothetical protein
MSKSRKRKRTRQAQPRQRPRVSSVYQRNIRQADDILAGEGVKIRPDNWWQLALDWFVPSEPERG